MASMNDIGSNKFNQSVQLAQPYGFRDMTFYARTDLVPECCASIKHDTDTKLSFTSACIANAFGRNNTIGPDINIELQCKDVWAKAESLKAVAWSAVIAVLAFI